jgi:hypothetical protein
MCHAELLHEVIALCDPEELPYATVPVLDCPAGAPCARGCTARVPCSRCGSHRSEVIELQTEMPLATRGPHDREPAAPGRFHGRATGATWPAVPSHDLDARIGRMVATPRKIFRTR